MTEPGTGSDLANVQTKAIRDGDEYVINGAKTFISCGQNADLVIVVAKTDPSKRHDGVSLLLVEAGIDARASRAVATSTRSASRARTRASSSSATVACRWRTCSAPRARASRC